MKPTYANVTSTVALILALGGVSYAATLPRNSVGKKQIRAKAVTLKKVAPKARRALRGQTGAPGVAGAAGAPGERGPTGPAGPAGPVSETPRKVRWLAYRFEKGVEADYDFGQLRIRATGDFSFFDVCRTGDLSAGGQIVVYMQGARSTQLLDPGEDCANTSYNSVGGEARVLGFGSSVSFVESADDREEWELLGYDTQE